MSARSEKSASAGGQDEQLCEVNNSATMSELAAGFCASADVVSAAYEKLATTAETVKAEAVSHVRRDLVFMRDPIVSHHISRGSIKCKYHCRDED